MNWRVLLALLGVLLPIAAIANTPPPGNDGDILRNKNGQYSATAPYLTEGTPSHKWSSYYAFEAYPLAYGSQVLPISQAYPYVIGTNLGFGPTVDAINNFSRFECDLVGATDLSTVGTPIFQQLNPQTQNNPLMTWVASQSDPTYGGAGGSSTHEAVARKCRLAGMTWLTIPRSYKTYGNSSACVATGTWSTDTSYGGNYGKTSNTQGDSLACTTTTYGGPIYAWYQLKGNDGGTFTWSLDGTTTGLLETDGGNNDFTFPMSSSKKAVAAVRIPVNVAGSHTVTFTLTSTTTVSNTATVIGLGTPLNNGYSAGAPTLFMSGQLYEAADGMSSWTAAYNNDIKTDVKQLKSDGLNVNFVDVRNALCCNSSSDMLPAGYSNYPAGLSAQGHKHLADAFGAIIQYEKSPGVINPKDYGAVCNTQIVTGTYTTGNNIRLANTTTGSNVITFSGTQPYKPAPGTASCSGGGGDVGKVISIYGAGIDVGPTTYIASVTSTSMTLGSGWAAAGTAGGYAVFGGCPSDPNDPSTAHDDTTAIRNASLAASVIGASSNANNYGSVGGSEVFLPNNCLVHNLSIAPHTALVGKNGGSTYSVSGDYNNPNSNTTRLWIASNGFPEDPSFGIDWANSTNAAFKNFTISSPIIPGTFSTNRGVMVSCMGSSASTALNNETVLIDHVTATLCQVGIGSPYGNPVQVGFTGSIADNGNGTSTMTVTSIDTTNISNKYRGTTTPGDWLAIGRTVSGPGVTTGTKITSAPTGGLTGDYILDHAMTVSSTGLISPEAGVFTQAHLVNSLIQTNGTGWNGSFSDAEIEGTWFTNNANYSIYQGPPHGSAGCGLLQITGGRMETNGAVVFDGCGQATITNFACQQSGRCYDFRNGATDIMITGGLWQGGGAGQANANDKSMVLIEDTSKRITIDGVQFTAWSPYGTTKYLLETATGFTGDYIRIRGTDSVGANGGTLTAVGSWVGGIPSHYYQDVSPYQKVDTIIKPTLSGLSFTSTGGGAYAGYGITSTTTSSGSFNLNALPASTSGYNCQGGNQTTGTPWGMSATTSTSCSLSATTTNGDSVWWSAQARSPL